MNSCDKMVIYDNIKYTKKGWINRNRILLKNDIKYLSIPLMKDSDFLMIKDRVISDNWKKEKSKQLNLIKESYRKSIYFDNIFPKIEMIYNYNSNNLFEFLYNSIIQIKNLMRIKTQIFLSSEIGDNHIYKGKDRVIDICISLGAKQYINLSGGVDLYEYEDFRKKNIELYFIKSKNRSYNQSSANEFRPYLSIVDLLMNVSPNQYKEYLEDYNIL